MTPPRSRPPRSRPTPIVPKEYRPEKRFHYLAFNKPFQVLSQFSRPEGSTRTTLADFDFPEDVYPVGRLDYDSEGLLLLSDDPALNNHLLDPSHHHPRTYLAQLEEIPSETDLENLRSGVIVEGRVTRSASAELLEGEPDIPPRSVPIRYRRDIPTSWIRLTLTEGRNRQVRRMTAAIGHPTLRLVRVAIGNLELRQLGIAAGEWRRLGIDELRFALQQ